MGKRRRKPRFRDLLLLLLVAVVAGVAIKAVVSGPATPEVSASDLENPFVTPSAAPKPPVPPLSGVLAKLGQKDRPFKIVIIGDSTGISEKGWQRQLTAWMGERTKRPVTYHQWQTAQKPDNYYPPFQQVTGTNSPIEVWNASAGGTSFSYNLENYDQQLPADLSDVDLLLVNHGHNVSPISDYYNVGIPFIDKLLGRWSGSTVVMMRQNPETEKTGHADDLVRLFGYIDRYAQDRQVDVVDVYDAFEKQPDPLALIDNTEFHPTPEGYTLWFEQIRAQFEPLIPEA